MNPDEVDEDKFEDCSGVEYMGSVFKGSSYAPVRNAESSGFSGAWVGLNGPVNSKL